MKIDWGHIYEGWRNHLVPPSELKKLILQTSADRLAICRQCQWNSKVAGKKGIERCMDCGCPLVAKTKCLSCYCELEFPNWEAVLTEQQDDELMNDDSS